VQNVLIIESDEQLLRERAYQLTLDGYEVQTAQADRHARLKLAGKPDAVVLCDVGSGAQTLRLLRELRAGQIADTDARVPVLAVGADDESAAVRLYRSGADVALPTRSSPLLITAGLEALAGRLDAEQQRRSLRRIGNLTIDYKARTAEANNRPINLTRREFDLLRTASARPDEVISRADLTREVWGFEPDRGSPRLVDSAAYRLNRKLDDGGAEPRMEVVRGIGYRLTR
jgi:DNA-binding response OmpR family regulator